MMPCVELLQRVRAVRRERTATARGPIERGVVMHHRHAVARQADVELEPVGADRKAVVERDERVFRAQLRPAAMREHQWRPERGDRM